jgi:DNA polymerase III epsilon subunit-like protein
MNRVSNDEGSEAALLKALFESITEASPIGKLLATRIVGHHVAGFDLPFLYKRAVINRIEVPHWIPWGAQAWDDRVYDTMYRWAGRNERVSLDKLCMVLDIPRKGSELLGDEEIDGSKVYEFWKAGRHDDLRDYCECDVRRARWIHRLMEFVHG